MSRDDRTGPLPPGSRLGDFVVTGPLAVGGAAKVYRAEQESLGGRVVALKVLPRERLDAEAEEAFRREARAAAELHHPHLAEVYGFGLTERHAFYAMRLVDGPTLAQALEGLASDGEAARRDEGLRRRAVERVAEVASALALVHARGLVHGDVKPGNVVLAGRDGDGSALPDRPAVLVDFGLVRAARGSRREHERSGTPAYMAPDDEVGPGLDVFGLGVTLHDLLAARRPDQRDLPAAGLEPIEELVPGIDRDLAAIVGMACDPDAAWRYPHAAELVRDLRRWLAGEPVAARRPPALERVARWVRRHPGRILRALAIGAAIAAGTAILAFSILSVRAVGAARAAHERGDLLELGRQLRAVDAIGARLLLEEELGALRARLAAPGAGRPPPVVEDGDAVVAAIAALDAGRLAEACALATQGLTRSGEELDPLLVRFLAWAIEGGADRSTAHALQVAALVQVGQFLHEASTSRPSQVVESCAPLRRSLLSVATDPPGAADLSPELAPRSLALSALGACATHSEIGTIVELLRASPDDSEDQRLALGALDLVVRRAPVLGAGLDPTEEPWWPELAPTLRECWARWVVEGRDPGESRFALSKLTEALAATIRRRGRPVPLEEILPRAILAEDSVHAWPLSDRGTWTRNSSQHALGTLAIAGDARVRANLEATIEVLAAIDDPDSPLRRPPVEALARAYADPRCKGRSGVVGFGVWLARIVAVEGYIDTWAPVGLGAGGFGKLLALIGEEEGEVRERMEEVLGSWDGIEHPGGGIVTRDERGLDRGIREGLRLLDGTQASGRETSRLARMELLLEPGVGRSPSPFVYEEARLRATPQEEDLEWHFTWKPPVTSHAQGARCQLVDGLVTDEERGYEYLVLDRPGRSELVLELDPLMLAQLQAFDEPELVIVVEPARMDARVLLGICRLEVLVGSRSVAGDLQALRHTARMLRVDLPAREVLRPEPPELRIRLSALSTSPCRIYAVRVIDISD